MRISKAEIRRQFGPAINPDGSIWAHEPAVYYNVGESTVYLEGRFTPDRLEAIAHWMRTHASAKERTPAVSVRV